MLEAMFRNRVMSMGIAVTSILVIGGSACLPIHDSDGWIYKASSDRFWLYFWTLQRFVFSIGVCGITLVAWYGSPGQ
jgi:hypothetical protein